MILILLSIFNIAFASANSHAEGEYIKASKRAMKIAGKHTPTDAKKLGQGADAHRQAAQAADAAFPHIPFVKELHLQRAEKLSDLAHSANQPGYTKKNVKAYNKAQAQYIKRSKTGSNTETDELDHLKNLAQDADSVAKAGQKIGGRYYDKQAASSVRLRDQHVTDAHNKLLEDKSVETTVIRKDDADHEE